MTDNQPFLKDMWDDIYAQGDGTVAAPDPLFTEIAAALPVGRAADLGAGDGANALWLAERGWRVTAVDYANKALDAAVQRAAAKDWDLTVNVGDLLAYRPDQPLDLVLFGYIHLPAPQRAHMLQQAGAMLAPGGTMIYIGITNVPAPNDQVPAEIFAPLSEVVADLPANLQAVRTEEKEHKVTYDGQEHQHTGVLVVAKRVAG